MLLLLVAVFLQSKFTVESAHDIEQTFCFRLIRVVVVVDFSLALSLSLLLLRLKSRNNREREQERYKKEHWLLPFIVVVDCCSVQY